MFWENKDYLMSSAIDIDITDKITLIVNQFKEKKITIRPNLFY